MYREDYDNNRQEQSDAAANPKGEYSRNADGTYGEHPADGMNSGAKRMESADGESQAAADGRYGSESGQTVSGSGNYGSSNGSGYGNGASQSASGSNYGSGNNSYNNESGQTVTGGNYGGSNYGGSNNSGSNNSGSNYGGGNYGGNGSYNNGSCNNGGRAGAGQPVSGNGYGTAPSGMNRGYGAGQPNPNSGYGHQQPNQHYAPWQQPHSFQQQNRRPDRKKKPHTILKKVAGITAAALLFGVVAGGTIAGINLVTNRFTASYALNETQASLSQAETIPAPAQPNVGNDGSSTVSAIPAITNDVSAIVEKAMPSVVAINSVMEYQTQNWFGQPQVYQGKGSGSGIIVGESDTELLIVTNNHVVEGAKSIGVVFTDNESVEANIKGTDSENDLAVVAVALDKIADSTKSKIAVATLGDSDSLKVGQGVIAIGNALGYGQSVTVGYVSALDREVKTDEQTTRNLLQTDAAINPGNSGGALLNMQGEVIGINSAKYSSTEVEGMGYAIPISKVHDIIDDLMTKKTRVQIDVAKQGYLGIQGTDIDSNASTLYGMPQGVYVYKIMDDGAAASSTLKEKDIITKFDGQTVRSMSELKNMLTYYAGGDSVQVTVQSLVDGQYVERQVELTLGTRPAEESSN